MVQIKKSKTNLILIIVFFAFSLIFMAISAIPYIDYYANIDKCDLVNAEITYVKVDYSDDDTTYTYYVTYIYNGNIYKNRQLKYSLDNAWEGDIVEIYVKRDNPIDIYQEPKELIPLFILGIVFSIIPTIILITQAKKQALERHLKNTGRKVRCKIISVDTDTSVRVNGKYVNSYLFCSPVDEQDGKTKYKSNSFVTPPKSIYNYFVDVYIDRDDKTKYYVDLSFLFESKEGYCKSCSEVDRDSLYTKKKVEYNHHTGEVTKKDIYCEYCCVRYSPKLKRCPNCKMKNKTKY